MVKFQASRGSVIVGSLFVVLFVASFISTLSTNMQLSHQQKADHERDQRSTIQRNCTTDFLGRAFEVLNERTAITPELNEANKQNVQSEGKLFGFIVATQGQTPVGENPPQATIDNFNRLTRNYFNSIQRYLTLLGRTNINQQVNPIPTKAQYEACLDQPLPSQ